jgi:regulator of sigma E protease
MMDNLATLPGWIWSNVVLFLLVLTVVVFIHELGHFLVARRCGVYVKAFSIGFGPELFGFYDRHGTRWRFALLPLGGYVKFLDDENAASKPDAKALERMSEEDKRNSFHAKPVSQRAAVVAAGPIANFLLAIVLYTGLNMAVGIKSTPALVDAVVPDSAAARAGFLPGDRIVEIEGQAIANFEDLQGSVAPNAGKELAFKVERSGQVVILKATPLSEEKRDTFGRTYRRGLIGIQRTIKAEQVQTLRVGPVDALLLGIKETASNVTSAISGIGDIVTRRQSAEQMGGPLLMAEVTAKVAELGPEAMLRWIAFISANVGFLNLLPIPVLDGGHLLFYGLEAIRRKPMGERFQQIGFQIGLAMIVVLMIFVNFNDLHNIWRRLTGAG